MAGAVRVAGDGVGTGECCARRGWFCCRHQPWTAEL